MLITKEWVDEVCPSHERTSCNDENLNNRHGGWYGDYRTDNGNKNIKKPRCTRCYLLSYVECDTESLEFEPVVEVWLRWKDSPKGRL